MTDVFVIGEECGGSGVWVKQQLTVRVVADVLTWLKNQGKGYQSRLNEILRTEMLEQTSHLQ
ncbi:MAG: BrnA antitoxin family protein [Methylobacter sp.]|nr:BrnA antitoxin family protein [Methylobacter sp.]